MINPGMKEGEHTSGVSGQSLCLRVWWAILFHNYQNSDWGSGLDQTWAMYQDHPGIQRKLAIRSMESLAGGWERCLHWPSPLNRLILQLSETSSHILTLQGRSVHAQGCGGRERVGREALRNGCSGLVDALGMVSEHLPVLLAKRDSPCPPKFDTPAKHPFSYSLHFNFRLSQINVFSNIS